MLGTFRSTNFAGEAGGGRGIPPLSSRPGMGRAAVAPGRASLARFATYGKFSEVHTCNRNGPDPGAGEGTAAPLPGWWDHQEELSQGEGLAGWHGAGGGGGQTTRRSGADARLTGERDSERLPGNAASAHLESWTISSAGCFGKSGRSLPPTSRAAPFAARLRACTPGRPPLQHAPGFRLLACSPPSRFHFRHGWAPAEPGGAPAERTREGGHLAGVSWERPSHLARAGRSSVSSPGAWRGGRGGRRLQGSSSPWRREKEHLNEGAGSGRRRKQPGLVVCVDVSRPSVEATTPFISSPRARPYHPGAARLCP